jgi:hypothetical protein
MPLKWILFMNEKVKFFLLNELNVYFSLQNSKAWCLPNEHARWTPRLNIATINYKCHFHDHRVFKAMTNWTEGCLQILKKDILRSCFVIEFIFWPHCIHFRSPYFYMCCYCCRKLIWLANNPKKTDN